MRAALALVLSALPALAADDPVWDRAALAGIEWGIICAEDSGERAEAPETITGYIDIYAGEPQVVRQTQQVPTLAGLSFGVIVRTPPGGVDGITITVMHPPMQPSGATRQRWTSAFDEEPSANFFTFDFPEERVPGAWRFVATQGDRVIYDVPFDVIDASAAPGASDPCPGPVPIS
jgi:hypothetical protein